jgi:hypothetical protein
MDMRQVPDWYVEAVQMMGHTDGVLRDLQFDLLNFMERQRPDWRVCGELQGLLEALRGAAGAVALVEMTTRRVVCEVRPAVGRRQFATTLLEEEVCG